MDNGHKTASTEHAYLLTSKSQNKSIDKIDGKYQLSRK